MRALIASLLALASMLAGSGPAGAAEPSPSAAPSCAAGPARIARTIVGTPCADVIVVPASVETVRSGGGSDTIVPAPILASASCPEGCRLGVGSQTFEGGPGDDVVFGERGNDILRGGEGNDRLYGGIGDDLLEGGPGNDHLSGGFGADAVDGNAGDDEIRGDGTQDELRDSGPSTDLDTLSYSTGVTPGFGNRAGYPDFSGNHAGFPTGSAERGVYLDLSKPADENGDNSGAPNGGGVDDVAGLDFERIVASPFADYIVGSKPGQQIFGGGGADVLIAGGAGSSLNGGADGDDCVGGAAVSSCESTAAQGSVTSRDKTKVSVGAMAPGAGGYARLYLIGGSGDDEVTVSSSGAAPTETVTFGLGAGSSFDESASASSGCTVATPTEAVCELSAPLDSVLLSGMEGNDTLSAPSLPATTSLVLLGGDGNDEVVGGDESDDALVDGPGIDVLHSHGGDDAVLNNDGQDELFGEAGNDLILSTAICEGDLLDGGAGRDNASWGKFSEGVEARLDQGIAGRPGPGGVAQCGGGSFDALTAIEDLEGSAFADSFFGDGGPNQLLGHLGADTYFAAGGEDTLLANSGDFDPTIDCGDDIDTAIVDRPEFGEVAAPNCENVFEAAPNDFRTRTKLSPPLAPPPPRPDTRPPRTLIKAHPPRAIRTSKGVRRVVFRFASNEPGSSFRCKLDRKPYRPCVSPRAYRLRPGRHAVRIFAIDRSGNADPTPALFRFRILRR
jgi:Ca2+-binding RTX toxin-like protein